MTPRRSAVLSILFQVTVDRCGLQPQPSAGWIESFKRPTGVAGAVGLVKTRPTLLLSLACQFILLTALRAQTPAENAQTGPQQVETDIPKEFDDIFSQSEFRGLREKKPRPGNSELPEWLKKFFDWLDRLFSRTGTALSGLGTLVQVLAYAVLAAICCLIIWLVVRAVNNYRERQTVVGRMRGSGEEGEGEIPPGDLPADEYLRRAAELAEKGLFREAIGQLILGAMSRTERSGLIRFRRGLTNRDYLRALHGRAMQHHAFRTIVGVYEPICFGRRNAQVEHYRTSLDGYQTGFQQPLPADAAAPRNAPAGAT